MPDDTGLIAAFLADRHVSCPRCTYDLHSGKGNTCPECGLTMELHLTPAYRLVRPLHIALLVLAASLSVCGVVLVIEIARRWHNEATLGLSGFSSWQSVLYDTSAFAQLAGGIWLACSVVRCRFSRRPVRCLTLGVWGAAVGVTIIGVSFVGTLVWMFWNVW